MESIRRPLYFLVTGMAISAVLLLVSAGEAVKHEKSAAVARQAAFQEKAPVGYILREYEGHLALFRGHVDKPFRILDTEVWLLPEEDRLAVQEGIFVETEAELRSLLEDWDE